MRMMKTRAQRVSMSKGQNEVGSRDINPLTEVNATRGTSGILMQTLAHRPVASGIHRVANRTLSNQMATEDVNPAAREECIAGLLDPEAAMQWTHVEGTSHPDGADGGSGNTSTEQASSPEPEYPLGVFLRLQDEQMLALLGECAV